MSHGVSLENCEVDLKVFEKNRGPSPVLSFM